MDDLELLRRFEPVLRFNAAELFLPSDVGAYVHNCSLWERQPDGTDHMLVDVGDLDLEVLTVMGERHAAHALHMRYVHTPLRRGAFRQWKREGHLQRISLGNRFARVGVWSRVIDALFRTSLLFRGRVPRGSVAAGEVTYREHIKQAGTPYYGRVAREAGWTMLTYWFFYPMNDWRSSFHGINDHEADWENLIVYLSPGEDGDLAPRWVAFSSHDGEGDVLRRRVDDPDVEWVGEHVVAYPGAGSHSHSPNPTDELVRVDPAILRRVTRSLNKVLDVVFPWRAGAGQNEGLSVPFVDYHRGDGAVVGPGGDYEWQPVVISNDTPWVTEYRGRWGLDTRDRFGGESAPPGPRYEDNGLDRVRWEDPLGWAGLQKVDPDPAAAMRAVEQRHAQVITRIAEVDADFDTRRATARRELSEAVALTSDNSTAGLAAARQASVRDEEAELGALRAERRDLDAERDALEMTIAKGMPPQGPRAHLGDLPRIMSDDAEAEALEASTKVRQRVLRIWAAVSTPLLLVIIIWLLVGDGSAYYGAGAIAGVLLIITFEALARGRLLSALGAVIMVVASIVVIIGLISQWRITLSVLLGFGAVTLLIQNIRELRSS